MWELIRRSSDLLESMRDEERISPINHGHISMLMKKVDNYRSDISYDQNDSLDGSDYECLSDIPSHVIGLREDALECVEEALDHFDAIITPYGSTACGTDDANSDLDILVRPHEDNRIFNSKYRSSIINTLIAYLKHHQYCNIINVIYKMGLVRFSYGDLHVDVIIGDSETQDKTRLIQEYMKYSSHLSPLIKCVKHWAKSRGLVDATRQLMNSWTLTLMCVQYLQFRDLLPVIHENSSYSRVPENQIDDQIPSLIYDNDYYRNQFVSKYNKRYNSFNTPPNRSRYRDFTEDVRDCCVRCNCYYDPDECETYDSDCDCESGHCHCEDISKYYRVSASNSVTTALLSYGKVKWYRSLSIEERQSIFIPHGRLSYRYKNYRKRNDRYNFRGILKEFFHFYSYTFNPSLYSISVRTGHLLFLEESMEFAKCSHPGLFVEQVFDPTDNTAKNFAYTDSLMQELQRASMLFEKSASWDYISHSFKCSLTCILDWCERIPEDSFVQSLIRNLNNLARE